MAEQELNQGQLIRLEQLRALGVQHHVGYKFTTSLSYCCPENGVYKRIMEVLIQASHGLGVENLEGWRFDYEAVGQVVEGAFLAVERDSQSTLYLIRWTLGLDPAVGPDDLALPGVVFLGLEPLGEVKLSGAAKLDAWRKLDPAWQEPVLTGDRLKTMIESDDFHQQRGRINTTTGFLGINPVARSALFSFGKKEAYDRWQDFRETDQCSFWFSRFEQVKHIWDALPDYSRPDSVLDVVRAQISRYEWVMNGEVPRYRFWLGMAVRTKPLLDVPKGNVALQIYDLVRSETLFNMEGYF